MSKQLLFNPEATDKLIKGMKDLTRAVGSTLGPKGNNVVIHKPYLGPHVTKDGVTVAKEVHLKDPIENMGVEMLRQAASETARVAGDGTTTSTILAMNMIDHAKSMIKNGDYSAKDLNEALTATLKEAVEFIRKNKMDIVLGSKDLEMVATISSNGDKVIGKLVSEAVTEAGVDGAVAIQESNGVETYSDIIPGAKFQTGYLSNSFVTDETKMTTEFQAPYILVCDEKIDDLQDIIKYVEFAASAKRPLVIVCNSMDSIAIGTLLGSHKRGVIKVCPVKSPLFGDLQKESLEDLATITGGEFISEKYNTTLSGSEPREVLGESTKVIIDKESMVVIGGLGSEEYVSSKVKSMKERLKLPKVSNEEKDRIKQRMARITGSIVSIFVGGETTIEVKELKDRVDDAVHATRAAVEEGVVPGGGKIFVEIRKHLAAKGYSDKANIPMIVALGAPMAQIFSNAEVKDVDLMNSVMHMRFSQGIDANTSQVVDLVEAGIIDPAKVSRVALEKAVAAAKMVISTSCVIGPEEKDKSMGSCDF